MKLPCALVRDLLPLYHDNVCSLETSAAVEEHLSGCEPCQQYYHELQDADRYPLVPIQEAPQATALQKVKRRIQKKYMAIVAWVLLACGGLLGTAWFLVNTVTVTMPVEAIASVQPGEHILGLEEPVPTLDITFTQSKYARYGMELWVMPVKEDGKQEFYLILTSCTSLKNAWLASLQQPYRIALDVEENQLPFITTWEYWEEGFQYELETGAVTEPKDKDHIFTKVYYFSNYAQFQSSHEVPPTQAETYLTTHSTLLWAA